MRDSRAALEELTGLRHLKSMELLRCFAEVRGRISPIALRKLRERPECASGLLSIWADDLHDVLPSGQLVAFCQTEQA